MKNNGLIGIIGAMECEINRLKSMLQNIEEVKHSQFTFYKGELFKKSVVIAKSGVGKVAGAVCTQIMIDKFNPDYIINTGVAGGLKTGMEIGEIVIANRLVQHDFDASVLGYSKGYICNGINPKEPTYFYPDKDLVEKFEASLKEKAPELKHHIGTIASGDMFVSSNEKKKEIKDLFDAYAVEMEGAAIAHTATLNNLPFVILRAISDLADDNASKKLAFTEEDTAHLSAKALELILSVI